MSCTCNVLRANNRVDPTKTLTLRRRFEADLVRRLKKVRRDIQTSIITNDAFALGPRTPIQGLIANEPISPRAFEFQTDSQKVDSFMAWLKTEVDREVLEVTRGTAQSRVGNRRWTDTYIRAGYDKGIRNASGEMRKQGATVSDRFVDAAFNRPIHADRAGLIFTRMFSELEGITNVMDQQISRVLAGGIIEGLGAKELARNINNRVDKIGITRSRVLARTEIVAAHAEATLNLYEEAGAEGVTVQAEFATAGDDDVCPECEALEGKIYTIEESHGIIPVHPNCRCTFLPVLVDPKNVELF